jgi:hypothetical protein
VVIGHAIYPRFLSPGLMDVMNSILTSEDGENWLQLGTEGVIQGRLRAILYANGQFFLVPYWDGYFVCPCGFIWTSADGMNWVARNPPGDAIDIQVPTVKPLQNLRMAMANSWPSATVYGIRYDQFGAPFRRLDGPRSRNHVPHRIVSIPRPRSHQLPGPVLPGATPLGRDG